MPSALKLKVNKTFFRSGKPVSNQRTFKRSLYNINYLMTCIKACTSGLIQCPKGVQWATLTSYLLSLTPRCCVNSTISHS